MTIQRMCKDYFHGFQDISNFKSNSLQTNVKSALKILSYFTVVVPASVGIVYGVSSLIGRVKRHEDSKISAPQSLFLQKKVLAEGGDANAQYDLAKMYETGRGAMQDPNEASKYYELAAKQYIALGDMPTVRPYSGLEL